MKEFHNQLLSYINIKRTLNKFNKLKDATGKAIEKAFESLEVSKGKNDTVVVNWLTTRQDPSPAKPDRVLEINHSLTFFMGNLLSAEEETPKIIMAEIYRSGAFCCEAMYNDTNAINLIEALIYSSAVKSVLCE